MTITAAQIALAPATARGGNGDICPVTDQARTLRGAPGTLIPRGEAVDSDPASPTSPYEKQKN